MTKHFLVEYNMQMVGYYVLNVVVLMIALKLDGSSSKTLIGWAIFIIAYAFSLFFVDLQKHGPYMLVFKSIKRMRPIVMDMIE